MSYLPRTRCKHEYITVTPEGFRFRGQVFDTVGLLFRWFKEHFRDPVPGTPSTPRSGVMTARATPFHPHTPNLSIAGNYGTNFFRCQKLFVKHRESSAFSKYMLTGVNPEAIQRVAQNIPSHMLHSLSQVANQTPHYPATPGGFNMPTYPNTVRSLF